MLQRFSDRAALVVAAILSATAMAHAGDRGQYTQVSPDIKAWVERLTDQHGVNCCATADGVRPKEVEWDISANSYRVKLKGQWIPVPDEAVIKGPNRLGHAVVWFWLEADFLTNEVYPVVRCFLPGTAA